MFKAMLSTHSKGLYKLISKSEMDWPWWNVSAAAQDRWDWKHRSLFKSDVKWPGEFMKEEECNFQRAQHGIQPSQFHSCCLERKKFVDNIKMQPATHYTDLCQKKRKATGKYKMILFSHLKLSFIVSFVDTSTCLMSSWVVQLFSSVNHRSILVHNKDVELHDQMLSHVEYALHVKGKYVMGNA